LNAPSRNGAAVTIVLLTADAKLQKTCRIFCRDRAQALL
jgi:hypothetical protein